MVASSPAAAQDITVADVRSATRHSLEAGRAAAHLLSSQMREAPEAERLATTSAAYRILLGAVHARARTLWARGRRRAAAEVALGFLGTPPVDANPRGGAPEGHYFLCEGGCSDYVQNEQGALVPADRRVTGRLNDLAFYIVDARIVGSDSIGPSIARGILAQIVRAHPERPAAMLNLADLLWNESRHEEAQSLYRRLLEVRGERAPARARERLASTPEDREPPLRQPFGPTPQITRVDEYSFQATAVLGTLLGGQVEYVSDSIDHIDGPASLVLIWTRGEQRISTEAVPEDMGVIGGPSPFRVRLEGQRVEVRYGTGGFSVASTEVFERWRLDQRRERFVRVSRELVSSAQGLDDDNVELTRLLRSGNFERARGLMLRMGPFGETTHDDRASRMYGAFNAARLRVAARWPRRRRAVLARAMVAEYLELLQYRQNDVEGPEILDVVRRMERWVGAAGRPTTLLLLRRFEGTDDEPELVALRDRLAAE